MKDYLRPENCNKAKCKTCIFGPTSIQLSPERLQEIHNYLSRFQSSHICHTTNKTCYGALELQSKILHSVEVITEPTVEAMLKKANEVLNFGPNK